MGQDAKTTRTSLRTTGTFVPVVKGKVFLYSLPSVGPRADPGVQAVSPQVPLTIGTNVPVVLRLVRVVFASCPIINEC